MLRQTFASVGLYKAYHRAKGGKGLPQRTMTCFNVKYHRRVVRFLSASLVAFCCLSAVAALLDFPAALITSVEKRWGRPAVDRIYGWRSGIQNAKVVAATKGPDSVSLKQVNEMWNKVPYKSDLKHWGFEDYWATPIESLSSWGGDCEDYSIGKYLSLKEVGVPIEKLRITYVRAINRDESHMVLAYYPTPDAEPYILDNLVGDIQLASRRPDLVPVFGFNDEDLWISGGSQRQGGASTIRQWRGLLEKLFAEQNP